MASLDAARLEDVLCAAWCKDLDIAQDGNRVRVSLPYVARDGDIQTLWLEPIMGGWRLTDYGTTLMRLSYEHEVTALLEGARGRLFEQILGEEQLEFRDGELVLESKESDLGGAVLRFSQALTRVQDLSLWTRARVASTFEDDLYERVAKIAGPERVHRDWQIDGLPRAEDYRVDLFVDTGREPLYVFGVPSKDKARLTTIVLLYLLQHQQRFESMVVFEDFEAIPRADVRRLMNAANDMIASIGAEQDLDRKIRHRIAG